jgi:hypothetical protein
MTKKRYRIRVGASKDYFTASYQGARELFNELCAQRWPLVELDKLEGLRVVEHIRAWAPGVGVYRR